MLNCSQLQILLMGLFGLHTNYSFLFPLDNFKNLVGDDAKYNADKMIEIFIGDVNDFSKAVCLNAAAGLIVGEKFSDFSEAYNQAREFRGRDASSF